MKSDKEFRESFKPLYVPSDYTDQDTLENKIVFSLAQLGEATESAVFQKLQELEPENGLADLEDKIASFLHEMFSRGLLNGHDLNGERVYNLNKITQGNKGWVNPDLLQPGVD